jgi:hypothetical protein
VVCWVTAEGPGTGRGAAGRDGRGMGGGERGGRPGSSPMMRRRPTLSAGTREGEGRERNWGKLGRYFAPLGGTRVKRHLTLGNTGNARTRGTLTREKHLPACFARDATFLVAFVISAFGRICGWLGLWLISHKSHSKSLTKQAHIRISITLF